MEITAIRPRVIAKKVLPRSAKTLIINTSNYILRLSYRYYVEHVPNRDYFPHILNAKRLFGQGVEIGTQRGGYSEMMLRTWKGARLYSIDPWREFSSEVYVDVANISQEDHDKYYEETVNRLKQFGLRSSILRKTSQEAAEDFNDGQLDFVYIDAQHSYEAAKADIELWYPKVKNRGVLAGHDYLDGHVAEGIFGVKSAVDEFANKNKLKLVISKEANWKSWFIFLI